MPGSVASGTPYIISTLQNLASNCVNNFSIRVYSTDTYCFNFPAVISRVPVPVAARPKAWVCDGSLAGIVGANPAGGMDFCCECCVCSGRGLCVRLITCTEESYRIQYV